MFFGSGELALIQTHTHTPKHQCKLNACKSTGAIYFDGKCMCGCACVSFVIVTGIAAIAIVVAVVATAAAAATA